MAHGFRPAASISKPEPEPEPEPEPSPGKPGRVATLAGWLRAVLSQHAAYLMACPQLLPMLTPLYQVWAPYRG